jgi:hypothetical protein
MHRPFNFITIFLGVVGMLSLSHYPLSVNAAEWSSEPSVRLSEGYDSNARLTVSPHKSVRSLLLAPKLNLATRSDIWQLSGNAEAVHNRFSGDSDLDADERFFNISTAYLSERSIWQLSGSRSKSSVLTDRQINSTTGLAQAQRIQDSHDISPSWTWSMNELTQLQLVYSLKNVSYVNGISIGLYDYSTRSISTSLTRSLDPQNKLFISAGYSIFNVPATTLNSKSATYQAGFTRIFSETSRGTVSAGLHTTSAEQNGFQFVPRFCFTCPPDFLEFVRVPVTIRSESTDIVFNGSFDKQFENNSLSISASRSQDPSGTGGQVQSDSLGLALNRSFTSKFSGGLSVVRNTSRTEIGNVSVTDYRFRQVASNLSWQWTPELNVDASYRYIHVRRASDANPVTSNAVYLAVKYQWQKMAISR